MAETLNNIIRQIQSGNHQAFENIINLYQNKMYNLSYRMTYNKEDAMDLCQEIFLRIYRKIRYFDVGTDFMAWSYKVAYNVCLNWRRRNKTKTLSLEGLSYCEDNQPFEIPDEKDMPSASFDKAAIQQEIRELITQLPSHYQLAVNLHYLAGMPYEKISEITASPLGTVKSTLFRAKELLKQKLISKRYK